VIHNLTSMSDVRGEYFDYDPLTGIYETYEETSDGQIQLHTYQDVSRIVESSKALAISGEPDEQWRKNGMTMYAQIPLVIVGQMLKKGINVFDQNHIGAVVREVNTNYPLLKTTFKNHEVR